MAGKRQKDPRALQGQQPKPALLVLPKPARPRPPACPKRADGEPLDARARARWSAMWKGMSAGAWDRDGDLAELARFILTYDLWLQLDDVVRRGLLVKGSRGQPRLNPAFAERARLGAELSRTAEAFGLTPRDRMRLGIEGADMARSMAAAERELSLEAYEDEFELPDGWEVANE
jgi:P27 family predicted phage terminase small subunit